jgi:hypothetical protein
VVRLDRGSSNLPGRIGKPRKCGVFCCLGPVPSCVSAGPIRRGVLKVEVRNDGVGGVDPRGHGLIAIADRVEALRGVLQIDSTDGDAEPFAP